MSLGQERPRATRHDLEEAVGAVLATEAPVTFHGEVSPILYAHCTSCHHEGRVVPFLADAVRRGEALKRGGSGGDRRGAMALLERAVQAVRADPSYPDAHFDLGLMKLRGGDYGGGQRSSCGRFCC